MVSSSRRPKTSNWAAQTSAITSTSVATLNGTFPGNNSFVHMRIEFVVKPIANIQFQIAPDVGYGGALYLNGARIEHEATDLWWAYKPGRTLQREWRRLAGAVGCQSG